MCTSQGKILCVSFDKRVSDDCCAALTEAGHEVVASSNIEDALGLSVRQRFDAVIIGHRFHAEEKYVLAVEAKEKWNIPVVLVCGATANSEMTRRVYALEGHAGLLSALSEVVASPAVRRAAA